MAVTVYLLVKAVLHDSVSAIIVRSTERHLLAAGRVTA